MISIVHSGSFKNLESFLSKMTKLQVIDFLKACGQEGVDALSAATPVRSGLVSRSWHYEVSSKNGKHSITWTNSDIEDGFPVAIMLQYGYGTGTGGYVQGQDYINPAVRPIFDRLADKVWKAVTSA